MMPLLRLLRSQKINIGSSSTGLAILLFLQSVCIPLLPLPGKFILDRFQKSLSETSFPDASHSLLGGIANWIEPFSDQKLLVVCSLTIIALGTFLSLLKLSEGWFSARINQRIFLGLRHHLNQMILTRKLSYLNQKKKIDLMGRVSADIEKLQLLFVGAVPTLFRSIPTIILTIIAMLLTDALIAGIFLVLIPLLYSSTFYFTRLFRKHNRSLRNAGNSYQEDLHQSYSFFAMAKSLGSEKSILEKLENSNKSLTDHFVKAEMIRYGFDAVHISIKALTRAIVLSVGCYFIFVGRITFGDFFLFFAYLEALIYPIDEINRFVTKWSKTLVAGDRIIELIAEMEQAGEESGEKTQGSEKIRWSLSDVSFAYENEDLSILKDFSLELEGPRLVAVVGPSGVGKSTFMSLFNKLYSPQTGGIRYADQSLADWDLKELRKRVLFIGQENFLISGSILDNLTLANPDISHTLAMEALCKVNGDGFVKQMERGLDSLIGEGGQGLSGGQARRICLARGFLSSGVEVAIFDEPTSGLDPQSAQQVLQSLREQSQQQLVLFSTHRMNEVAIADSLLVFSRSGSPQWIDQQSEITQWLKNSSHESDANA